MSAGDHPPDALAAANDIRRAVARLARRLRRLRADHGVSAAKLSVLGQLHRAGRALTAVDLAKREHLQPQSLTRIIAELDARGLLMRRQDAADHRQILISITDAGTALLMKDASAQTAWLAASMADRLTASERAVLHVAAGLLDLAAEPDTE